MPKGQLSKSHCCAKNNDVPEPLDSDLHTHWSVNTHQLFTQSGDNEMFNRTELRFLDAIGLSRV